MSDALKDALLDPQRYYQRRLDAIRPSGEWNATTQAEAEAWQAKMRGRVRAVIGLPDEDPVPPEPRVIETKEFPEYRRETILFRVRKGLDAFAYFLTPKGVQSPSPAVLCLPGHGRGVDSIVGIAEDGSQRGIDEPDEYQADFALQCVKHGYPTLAIEQISFGHRRDAQAYKAGGGSSSCTRDTTAAFMLGESMIGWRVWDAMRALDYMETRPEVDAHHIATMGISGGGLTSLWTAALDPRVRVAVVSGYYNTFRECVLAMDHCVDNYGYGISNLIEMPDLAGLIAPRALFVESGTTDPIFPLPATEQAVKRAQRIYKVFESSDKFDHEIFEGDHQFHGKGAFEFLESAL